jgi:hypothetical protein
MDLTGFIQTLIQRGDYAELRGHHNLMRIAGSHMLRHQDPDIHHVLCCALDYAEKYGKYPSFPALEEFCLLSSHVGSNAQSRMNWSSMAGTIADNATSGALGYQGSWPQLLDELTLTARRGMYDNALYIVKGILWRSDAKFPDMGAHPARVEVF